MQCAIRKDSFVFLTRLKLHLWRHDVWPSQLANGDDVKRGDKRPTLTRNKNQLNENFHTLQLNKTFFVFVLNKAFL